MIDKKKTIKDLKKVIKDGKIKVIIRIITYILLYTKVSLLLLHLTIMYIWHKQSCYCKSK